MEENTTNEYTHVGSIVKLSNLKLTLLEILASEQRHRAAQHV
jgi:hypothetical protein